MGARSRTGPLAAFYKASRSRFFFLVIGIPISVFMVVVYFSYVMFATTMLFVPIGLIAAAMVPGAVRSKKWFLFPLKINVIFMLAFTGLVPNPTYWGSQIHRRLDHSLLITPNDPAVMELNETTMLWAWMAERYGGATPADFEAWDVPVQATRVYYYIRSIVKYTYDIDNQQVFDYAATPAEVLASGKDDCQGISCVTVSLLIYLGFDAVVCETPFHWYIRVFYVNQTTSEEMFVDIYRSSNHRDPMYMFNHQSTWYLMNPVEVMYEAFTFDYVARKFHDIMNGTLDLSVISSSLPATEIPASIGWAAIFVACLGLAFVVTLFLRIPSLKRGKWHGFLASSAGFALPAFAGFYSITWIPHAIFLPFGFGMVAVGILLADFAIPLVHSRLLKKLSPARGAGKATITPGE